nr:MAG TPA: hypothetical protein [Bacteriophage sp.]
MMNIIKNKIMNDPQIKNNPMAQNAMQMIQSGNTQGLKSMAENMCKERGITVEQAKEEVMKLFN